MDAEVDVDAIADADDREATDKADAVDEPDNKLASEAEDADMLLVDIAPMADCISVTEISYVVGISLQFTCNHGSVYPFSPTLKNHRK